ncbi:hypothetical protein C9I88_13415 [Photobacterium iliopiscarium]|uniref:Uncharacterized protein n=1 Tax=Photobacterium iliopiscarium TaxID=56192 RepID=A0A2T3MJ08_9GAMM|nr:hypothetical protein C9I88_13415 [Photobacterium iliopiscarium]
MYYGSFGKIQKSLDCLRCSNIDVTYSGYESYFSTGLIIKNFLIGADFRFTDNRSKVNKTAHDPWQVGPSYNNNYSNIPDPEIILFIGFTWQ